MDLRHGRTHSIIWVNVPKYSLRATCSCAGGVDVNVNSNTFLDITISRSSEQGTTNIFRLSAAPFGAEKSIPTKNAVGVVEHSLKIQNYQFCSGIRVTTSTDCNPNNLSTTLLRWHGFRCTKWYGEKLKKKNWWNLVRDSELWILLYPIVGHQRFAIHFNS